MADSSKYIVRYSEAMFPDVEFLDDEKELEIFVSSLIDRGVGYAVYVLADKLIFEFPNGQEKIISNG